jgi:hypothetical protein
LQQPDLAIFGCEMEPLPGRSVDVVCPLGATRRPNILVQLVEAGEAVLEKALHSPVRGFYATSRLDAIVAILLDALDGEFVAPGQVRRREVVD